MYSLDFKDEELYITLCMKPICLSIAGSDPSGGAGLQLDLRVFGAHEVRPLSVVSSLTAQNASDAGVEKSKGDQLQDGRQDEAEQHQVQVS